MLGRPLRRRLSKCPSCKSGLSMCLARANSAYLFHVSVSGAIIAAATANSRRLSQQNPYKTCVSLVELGRTSPHFIVHFEKISTKKFPRFGRCAVVPKNVTFRRNVEFVEAFWNSYRGRQNVELSTGKRDPSTVKRVVPRDLLGHRRTLWYRARARSMCGIERQL